MYNCFDIAKFFLSKAKDDGMVIDTMKLLKLTYIAHGYNLGFKSKPLFFNEVQAWKYGPVIPKLYHAIKRFNTGNVGINLIDLYSETEIKEEDKHLLSKIWDAYKRFTGLELSTKTHLDGTPWAVTFEKDKMNSVIPNDTIEFYYKKLINDRKKSN